jgi:hypothetical protein
MAGQKDDLLKELEKIREKPVEANGTGIFHIKQKAIRQIREGMELLRLIEALEASETTVVKRTGKVDKAKAEFFKILTARSTEGRDIRQDIDFSAFHEGHAELLNQKYGIRLCPEDMREWVLGYLDHNSKIESL